MKEDFNTAIKEPRQTNWRIGHQQKVMPNKYMLVKTFREVMFEYLKCLLLLISSLY